MKKPAAYKTLSCNINPMFDTLWLAAGETFKRKPPGTPHCDCKLANEKHFDIKIVERVTRTHPYAMVPVETVDGACVHCGHIAPLLQQQDHTGVIRRREHARATVARALSGEKSSAPGPTGKPRGRKPKAIIGTNPQTGETIEFESTQAAYRAGHHNVHKSMEKNKPFKGWLWSYK